MEWQYKVVEYYGALTSEQKNTNALLFFNYFKDYMTLQAIAGMLGNISIESQLNPGQIEADSQYNEGWSTKRKGHGFIQWTGGDNSSNPLLDWKPGEPEGINSLPWYDGYFQCYRIQCEGEAKLGAGGCWFKSSKHPEYDYTWNEFRKLTDIEEAVKAYLFERERAGVEKIDERIEWANYWYNFLYENAEGAKSFIPRLDNSESIYNNPLWISSRKSSNGYNGCWARNEFSDRETLRLNYPLLYNSNSVLPNCTGYAWGRAHEIMGGDPNNRPKLSINNAGVWYNEHSDGYIRSDIPREGAIACWSNPGQAGHVAVVEQIDKDTNGNISQITISESGFTGGFNYNNYYWITKLDPSILKVGAKRWTTYVFQGFIYLPSIGGAHAVPPVQMASPRVLQITDTDLTGFVKLDAGSLNNLSCIYSTGSDTAVTLDLTNSYSSDSNIVYFKITGLSPNTTYTFYLTARNSAGLTKSPSISFKTNQSFPQPVQKIHLNKSSKSELNLPSSNFKISFLAPTSWGYWGNSGNKGYKIYLISNGKILSSQIKHSSTDIIFNFTPSNFLNEALKVGETLQIGVQSFVQIENTKLYSPMVCSNAIQLRESDFNIYLKTF